jgi:ATP-dependent RNA helicase RhlE
VPETYVHRIGRTARAGADGMAISFCDREERAFLRDIERLTRQAVPVMEAPSGFAQRAPAEAAPKPAPQQQRSSHGQHAAHGDHRGRDQTRRPDGESRSNANRAKQGRGQAGRNGGDATAFRSGTDGAQAFAHWGRGGSSGRGRGGQRRPATR